jgi:hypothetical protein
MLRSFSSGIVAPREQVDQQPAFLGAFALLADERQMGLAPIIRIIRGGLDLIRDK